MVGYVSPRVKRAASPSSTLSLETSAWPMLAPLSKHLTSHRSSRLFVCVFLSGTVWMCVPTSDGGIHNCNDAFAAKVDALKSRLIGNVSAFGGDEPNAVRWVGTESGHPDCPSDTGLWSSTVRVPPTNPTYPATYTNDCGAANGTMCATHLHF
jgi:hypothetical protein